VGLIRTFKQGQRYNFSQKKRQGKPKTFWYAKSNSLTKEKRKKKETLEKSPLPDLSETTRIHRPSTKTESANTGTGGPKLSSPKSRRGETCQRSLLFRLPRRRGSEMTKEFSAEQGAQQGSPQPLKRPKLKKSGGLEERSRVDRGSSHSIWSGLIREGDSKVEGSRTFLTAVKTYRHEENNRQTIGAKETPRPWFKGKERHYV